MKKFLSFAFALVLVGQGCLSPAPNTGSPQEQTPSAQTTAEGTVGGSSEGVLEEGVLVFEIVGTNGAYTPNQITVPQGQKMRVRFKSAEGFHDWTVDAFAAHTMRVNTGEEAVVEFTPDQAGTFEFYSSVGADRSEGMTGTLIVVEAAPPAEEEGGVDLYLDAETELKL